MLAPRLVVARSHREPYTRVACCHTRSPYSGEVYIGTLRSIHKHTRNQLPLPSLPRVWSPVLRSHRLRRLRRWGYFMVVAIARMRRLSTRATLHQGELNQLVRVYHNAGAMRTARELVDLFSELGLSASLEDVERWLRVDLRFTAGVVRWSHFRVVAQMLKAKFIKESEVPDSHVAFVALGGQTDLSGEVNADYLREVVKRFALTVDIEAFIEEADADGSGLLEFDEFAALFEENESGECDVNAADDREHGTSDGERQLGAFDGKSDALAVADGAGKRASVLISPSSHEEVGAHGDDGSVTRAGVGAPVEVGGSGRAQDAAAVAAQGSGVAGGVGASTGLAGASGRAKDDAPMVALRGLAELLERPPPTPTFLREAREEERRRAERTRGRRSAERGAVQENSTEEQEQRQQRRRRKLWERGGEREARERLIAARQQERANGGVFGSARRFDIDRPLVPLPPPRGPATPRPLRPNFRDGSWCREAFREAQSRQGTRYSHAPPPRAGHSARSTGEGASYRHEAKDPAVAQSGRAWSAFNPFAAPPPHSPSEATRSDEGNSAASLLPPIRRQRRNQCAAPHPDGLQQSEPGNEVQAESTEEGAADATSVVETQLDSPKCKVDNRGSNGSTCSGSEQHSRSASPASTPHRSPSRSPVASRAPSSVSGERATEPEQPAKLDVVASGSSTSGSGPPGYFHEKVDEDAPLQSTSVAISDQHTSAAQDGDEPSWL